MRPAHLSKLLVRGADLDDLALLHCEWALGLDRFAALRTARLAAGIPRDAGRTTCATFGWLLKGAKVESERAHGSGLGEALVTAGVIAGAFVLGAAAIKALAGR